MGGARSCMPAARAALADSGTGPVDEGGGVTRSSMPKRATQLSARRRWSMLTYGDAVRVCGQKV